MSRLETLVEEYLQEQTLRRLAASTERNYRYILGLFVQVIGSALPIQELSQAQLGHYVSALQVREFSAITRAEHLRKVRSFLRWCLIQGHVSKNPAELFRPPQPPRGQPWIPTQEQVQALLNSPLPNKLGWRDRVVLELLYGTGLRRAEVAALELRDVDLDQGALCVRNGKHGKDRWQVLGDGLVALLRHYLSGVRPALCPAPDEPALLLTRSGGPLQSHSVNQIVKTYSGPLGLPQMGAHALRRAFATHMMEGGARLEEVQALLGHESPETTVRYTQAPLKEIRETYRATHPRARRKRPGGCAGN